MLGPAMNVRRKPSFAEAIRALRASARVSSANCRAPLSAFVAYADVVSARNALNRVSQLLQASHRHAELRPMLWRFSQLHDPRWRETALRDATQASALVLAMPDESTFCPQTQSWITALLERRRGTALNVWTLIGDDDAWTMTLSQPHQISTLVSGAPTIAGSVAAAAPREVFASVVPRRITACAA